MPLLIPKTRMFLLTHVLEWFPTLKQRVFAWLYQFLAGYSGEEHWDWTFMNYGYAGKFPLPLLKEDEPDRYCCQLYAKVVDGVCLKNKIVIEVGCGRGGGLSFLQRYYAPESSHGIDLCQKAIAFCRRRHDSRPGTKLVFRTGDAANIPYDDGMVDVVVNVESSHCYPSRRKFFAEAYRVLKPGGKFCYADLHEAGERERIEKWLADAGFAIDVCEDITAGVVEALSLDNARKQQLIAAKAPWWLRKPFGSFAGLVGSRPHRSFVTGARRYTRWQLSKP